MFQGVEANDASSFADFEEKAPFPGGSTPLKTKRISKESSYEITVGIPLGNVSEGTGGCNEPKTAVNERPSKDSEGTDVARESVLEKPNRRKPHRPSRDVPALSTPELTSKSFSPRIPSRVRLAPSLELFYHAFYSLLSAHVVLLRKIQSILQHFLRE